MVSELGNTRNWWVQQSWTWDKVSVPVIFAMKWPKREEKRQKNWGDRMRWPLGQQIQVTWHLLPAQAAVTSPTRPGLWNTTALVLGGSHSVKAPVATVVCEQGDYFYTLKRPCFLCANSQQLLGNINSAYSCCSSTLSTHYMSALYYPN